MREFKEEFIGILRSRTAKQYAQVLLGTISHYGFLFGASVVAARALGPASFGQFSLALSIVMLVAMLADVGASTGVVRFFAPQRGEARKILVSAVVLKLILGLLFVGLGSIAVSFLESEPLAKLLRLALITGLMYGLFETYLALSQAERFFKRYAMALGLKGFGIFLGTLLIINHLTPYAALLPYAFAAAFGVLIMQRWYNLSDWSTEHAHTLFKYGRWVMLASVCTLLFNKLDVILLGYYLPSSEVGVYASALTLASGFFLLIQALLVVLLPKVTSFNLKKEGVGYIKQSLLVTIPSSLGLCALVTLSAPLLIQLVYGSEYSAALPVFLILLIPFGIQMVTTPLTVLIYALDRGRTFFLVQALTLLAVLITLPIAIPVYGISGAALSMTLLKSLDVIVLSGITVSDVIRGPV